MGTAGPLSWMLPRPSAGPGSVRSPYRMQSPEQAKRPLTLAEAGSPPAILYGGIVPLWPAGETAPGAGPVR